jgi:hypothetical protein
LERDRKAALIVLANGNSELIFLANRKKDSAPFNSQNYGSIADRMTAFIALANGN